MLYVKIISKNKRDGCYIKFEDNYIAELRFNESTKHKKSSTASRIELLTPTGQLLKFHDYV